MAASGKGLLEHAQDALRCLEQQISVIGQIEIGFQSLAASLLVVFTYDNIAGPLAIAKFGSRFRVHRPHREIVSARFPIRTLVNRKKERCRSFRRYGSAFQQLWLVGGSD